MTLQTKRILTSVFFSMAVVSVVAVAGNVTLPNTFAAGTPARAAEVNANFAAVKTAVDDNQAQITALGGRVTAVEARACPSGTSRLGPVCIETSPRAAKFFLNAASACVEAGGDLCSGSVLMAAACGPAAVPTFGAASGSGGEWAYGSPRDTYVGTTYAGSWAPVITRPPAGSAFPCEWIARPATNGTGTYPNESRAFRCCFSR